MISECVRHDTLSFHADVGTFDLHERYLKQKKQIKTIKAENRCFVDSNLDSAFEEKKYSLNRSIAEIPPLHCSAYVFVFCSNLGVITIRNSSKFEVERQIVVYAREGMKFILFWVCFAGHK